VIVSPAYFPRMSRNWSVAQLRPWVEYSVSSSIMIVLIALLVGISDAAALLALAG